MTNVIDLARIPATKAVIFTRVSSREQEDGYSLEAQKHRLLSYCQRNGLDVLRVFEVTESSTKGDRVKFMDMIRYCKSQRQPIAVVVDKIDRLQRNFKETPILESLVQAGKIELHSNTENCIIHRDSRSQERMMWSIGIIFAQSYVDSLRDNVKRSMEQKIRMGEYVSRAPLGYLNMRNNGRGDIVIDETRADLVLRIFTEYATGLYTLRHITDKASDWGLRTRSGKPVSRSQVYEILTNPFYYGMMRVKEKLYPHKYPPLVSKYLFDQCTRVHKNWNKKPFCYGDKEFTFRGILTCKRNGRTVSSFTKSKTYKNGTTGEWTYLQSWDENGKLIYIREEKLLEQAQKALAALKIPAEVMEATIEHLRQLHHAEHDFQRRRAQELHKEAERIKGRMLSLTELLIDKTISRDEYDTQRAAYSQRLIDIENETTLNRNCDDGFKDAMLLFMDLAQNAQSLFRHAPTERKRELLNFVFWNLQIDGTSLCFNYRNPFSLFINTG